MWEFIYCTGGTGIVRFAAGQLEFGRGMTAVIPPDLTYTLAFKGSFTNIYVRIQDAFLYQKKPFVFPDRDGFVLNAFQAASVHYTEKNSATYAVLRAYCYLIMTYAKTSYKEQLRSETVKEIIDDIQKNYANVHYELDTYLESLPFSEDYIRKLFKREVGATPHRYLSDLRLTAAEGWLNSLGKEANITEIARRCGFREPLYFSKMFKKKYGQSPSHYVAENGRKISPEDA